MTGDTMSVFGCVIDPRGKRRAMDQGIECVGGPEDGGRVDGDRKYLKWVYRSERHGGEYHLDARGLVWVYRWVWL